MKNLIAALVTIFAFLSIADAEILFMPNPVSLQGYPNFMTVSAFRSLVREKARDANLITICAEIREVPRSFLCVPTYQEQMNKMLTRIGVHWGAANGFPTGTLIAEDNQVLKQLEKIVVGHNLPGNVIARYFQDAVLKPNFLNEQEMEFQSQFISSPIIQSLNENYYLISFSAQSSQNYLAILDHEIHHARYYLNPEIKAAIDEFWYTIVSPDDQVEIRKILGSSYNSNNETVIVDEFQAYILETGDPKSLLAPYVGKYQKKLIAHLISKVAEYSILKTK